MRRKWIALFSAAVLGGVTLLAVSHPELTRAFSNSLTSLSPAPVAIAFLLTLAQVSAQALRLWAIIPRDTPLSVVQAGYTFTVGNLANIFIPARGGDALKILLVNRAAPDGRLSFPRATGAVLADKAIDVGTLVLFCAIAGLTSLLVATSRATLPGLRVLIAAAVALVVLLLALRYGWSRWLATRRVWLRELQEGLSALRDPARCAVSLSFSLAAWVTEMLALRALGIAAGVVLPVSRVFLALVILNLSITVPVSVANLGVYEAGLAYGLTRSGVPLPVAVTMATAHHALQLLGISLSAAGYALANQLWPGARDTADGVHGTVK